MRATTQIYNKIPNDILNIAFPPPPNIKFDPNSFTSCVNTLSGQSLLQTSAIFFHLFLLFLLSCVITEFHQNMYVYIQLLLPLINNYILEWGLKSNDLQALKIMGNIIQKQNNYLNFLQDVSTRGELQIQQKFSTITGMNCS